MSRRSERLSRKRNSSKKAPCGLRFGSRPTPTCRGVGLISHGRLLEARQTMELGSKTADLESYARWGGGFGGFKV